MIRYCVFIVLLISSCFVLAQNNLSEVLENYNTQSIPYISVMELFEKQNDVILLDAREKKEYEVSHIKNAIFVGYEDFDVNATLQALHNTSKPIVVYCSIGVRSEDIAEKLKSQGYANVFNLYGGIFEWKNMDFPVVKAQNKITDSIHAYSKRWGKWLNKGIKVYE